MKVLKSDALRADRGKGMGALAVTTTPLPPAPRREPPGRRRAGIRMTVVGVLLTLLGAVTVLVTRDGGGSGGPAENRPSSAPAGEATATTLADAPAVDRPPGTLGSGSRPVTPASPTLPPPATPQEVANLLAGLPLQLEQAATAGGKPRELTPEEVDKIVEDLLGQLGAKG